MSHTAPTQRLDDDRSSEPSSGVPARAPHREVGSRIGRFIVLEVIGEGGMGVVYAAYDPKLDRKVALKLVRAHGAGSARSPSATDAQARLLREAQALGKLSHPNVVAVFDVGTVGDDVFMAMELVPAETLREWLGQRNRDWREIKRVMITAARGLAAAHAAGLVHRDVKPTNILVEPDGNARLVDFGLARSDDFDGDRSTGRHATSIAVTRTGLVMGTPAYMAPEQLHGGTVTPAADQFSFCVTLFEALYGQRPFTGDDQDALARAISSGELTPVPAPRPGVPAVPPWLRRVVLRGLAVSPEDRHPSTAALMDALSRDPQRRRRVVLAAALGMAGTAALAIVAYRTWAESAPCSDPDSKLAGRWDAQRKQEVERAFAAMDKTYATDSWARVEQTLDAYAARWIETYTEACEATHVLGEQSPALLDLRMACLSSRAEQLGALVDVLARADANVVEHAVTASRSLGDLAPCSDAQELTAVVPPPDDEAARAEVAAIRDRLARAEALRLAGRYDAGLEIAEAVAREAEALGHQATLAEALYVLGRLQAASGASATAADTLYRAVGAAEAGRHDVVAADAWISLTSTTGVLARHDEARRWADRADAAVARRGEDPVQRSAYHHVLGTNLNAERDRDAALDHLQKALALRQEALGPDDPEVGNTLNSIGNVLSDAGEFESAREHYERAVAIMQSAFGPAHPDVAFTRSSVANALYLLGRYDPALEEYAAAESIWEGSLGRDHPNLGVLANNVANVLAEMGRNDEALDRYRRALAIWEKAYGPDHPNVASAAHNIGFLLRDAGDFSGARAQLARAQTIYERLYGRQHVLVADTLTALGTVDSAAGDYEDAIARYHESLEILAEVVPADHPNVTFAHANLGVAHRRQEHWAEASEHFEHALAQWEASLGADHPLVAQALLDVGLCAEKRHRMAEARDRYERADAIRRKHPLPPDLHAESAFALARALWSSDPMRALDLANEAQDLLSEASSARTELDAWLARRSVGAPSRDDGVAPRHGDRRRAPHSSGR